MNNREFVYYRNPDLEGVGRMSRAALARHPDFYECDADGKRLKKSPEPTKDAGQKADKQKPTAWPAGKSEER